MQTSSRVAPARSPLRRLALLLPLAAALALGGCNDQEAQLSELSDTFQKRLDEKEKELSALRLLEGSLRAQVSENYGKVQVLEKELAEAKAGAKATIDARELARELAPLLGGGGGGAARPAAPTAPSAPAASGDPNAIVPNEKFELSTPRRRDGPPEGGGDVPSAGKIRNTSGSGSVRNSSGGGGGSRSRGGGDDVVPAQR